MKSPSLEVLYVDCTFQIQPSICGVLGGEIFSCTRQVRFYYLDILTSPN